MEGSHFTPAAKIDWLLDEILELQTLGRIKQEEIEGLTEELEALKYKVSSVSGDLESELELVNTARRTMHAELEKLRGELADSRDVLVNRNAQITQLQSSLNVANANLHRVTDELASSGNELAGAKYDLNEARKEQYRLEGDIRILRQEIEDIEDSKDSDAELNVVVQELRTQLKSETLMHAETKKLLEAARNGRGL